MKVAIFKNLEHNFTCVNDDGLEGCESYVRLSEYVDVDFPLLSNEDVVAKQVDALEEAKKNIQAQTERKLTEIDRQIGELLALPQQVA